MKLLGVIEGFYGRPWTASQRSRLFGWMRQWQMNTYLYAPKDDLWHRARWREPYPEAELLALTALIREAQAQGVRFVYALAPGLDLNWERQSDRAALEAKFSALAALGVQDFALLFDDIPNQADRRAQGAAQVEVAHHLRRHLRPLGVGGVFLFCPTEYCGEMATPSVAASPYLRELARLDSDIEVLWTGPKIVSSEISAESVREVAGVLKRRPVLWDNLHASDYTVHRLHLGPYAGRPLTLRAEVAGILSNPNTPLEPNFPGLFSLADYASAGDDWTPEASGKRALSAWQTEFGGAAPEDLELLADTLYLPHRLGPRAEALLRAAQGFAGPDSEEQALLRRGRATYQRLLSALERGHNRDLLFDLHPYLVDLIEELTRLLTFAEQPGEVWPYRGALADKLLELGPGGRCCLSLLSDTHFTARRSDGIRALNIALTVTYRRLSDSCEAPRAMQNSFLCTLSSYRERL